MSFREKIRNGIQILERSLTTEADNSFESHLADAKKGVPEMQVNVAQFYLFGIGVEKNEKEALYWFEQAEKMGGDRYGFLYYHLGRFYEYGQIKPQNYQKAIEYYQLAINRDNALAKTELGRMYLYGKGVGINYDKAKALFLQAENIDSDAAFELGNMYLFGKCVEVSLEKAIFWLKKAEEQSADPNIQFILACAYQEYQLHHEAIYWFEQAAEQNNHQAMNSLADYLAEGIHITQNGQRAIELYTQAAELGNASAQANLGYYYLEGELVEQDVEKAVYWTLAAVKQQQPFAMYNFAMFHLNGLFEFSETEAKYWLEKVAAQDEDRQIKQQAEKILSELN